MNILFVHQVFQVNTGISCVPAAQGDHQLVGLGIAELSEPCQRVLLIFAMDLAAEILWPA